MDIFYPKNQKTALLPSKPAIPRILILESACLTKVCFQMQNFKKSVFRFQINPVFHGSHTSLTSKKATSALAYLKNYFGSNQKHATPTSDLNSTTLV